MPEEQNAITPRRRKPDGTDGPACELAAPRPLKCSRRSFVVSRARWSRRHRAGVLRSDNKTWSTYGAERTQPTATASQSRNAESGSATCEQLPMIATSCGRPSSRGRPRMAQGTRDPVRLAAGFLHATVSATNTGAHGRHWRTLARIALEAGTSVAVDGAGPIIVTNHHARAGPTEPLRRRGRPRSRRLRDRHRGDARGIDGIARISGCSAAATRRFAVLRAL